MIKKYSYQFEEIGDDVVVEYPDGDVFLRERNYVKIYTEHETNCTLFSVTIAGKEIRFNYDLSKPITFDVSPYYAKGATSIAISVKYNDVTGTFTIPLSLTTFDCYSPFKEFAIPEPCVATQYARITPPNRMLWDGSKSVTSMFAAMRGAETTNWSINGAVVDNDIVFKSANIGADGFLGELKSGDVVIESIKRSVEEADRTREYVYMRWKTPWGYSVEHLFYLDTFGADKDNAKELDSAPLNYSESSDYIRKGSIYLDNIRDPYDLFYYKTLETAEVVEIWTPRFNISPSTYMPDGTAYEAVKITGSNVADAVVDGVTQQTITFKFELL